MEALIMNNNERMISHDMLVALLTQHDSVSSLQSSNDEKAKGFWLAVSSGVREFNVMNSHPVGQLQQQLLSHLVDINAVTQEFSDAAIEYANTAKQTKTIEVSYPSESYIICTSDEGIDVYITSDVDAKFKVYLAVCTDNDDHTNETTYAKFSTPVLVGTSDSGKLALSLGSRKVRTYNKLFIECDNPEATFSASCVNNRG